MERSNPKRFRTRLIVCWAAFCLLAGLMALVVAMELRAAYRYRQTAAALALVKKIGIGDNIEQWRGALLQQGANEVPGCYVLRNDDSRYAFLERLIGPRFDDNGRHTLLLNLAANIGFRATSFRAEICVDESSHRVTSRYVEVDYSMRNGSWREASFSVRAEGSASELYHPVRPGYAVHAVSITTLGGGLGIAARLTTAASKSDVERASNVSLRCLISRKDCHICRVMPDAWRDSHIPAEWDADRELSPEEIQQAKRSCDGFGDFPSE